MLGQVTPEGRAELRILEGDPMVGFRAPGTKLRSQDENAATEPTSSQEANATKTVVDQVIEMPGDPAATVEAYRAPALAAGWRLVFEGCSRYERAIGFLFTRTVDRYEAFLRVRGQLPNPVPERERLKSYAPAPNLNDRHLRVTFGPKFGPNIDPVSAAPRNNGPDCLRTIDPSDPDLAWPEVPSRTGEALCERLSVAAARAIVPAVDSAVAENDEQPACAYRTGTSVRFRIIEAYLPRAFYDDRRETRLDPVDGRSEAFLFYVSPYMGSSAWVEMVGGPVLVTDAAVPASDRLTELQLRLVGARVLKG